MRALHTALESPLRSVKLNAVIIKGLNDSEVPNLLALAKDTRLCVRFIEYMPFTGPFPLLSVVRTVGMLTFSAGVRQPMGHVENDSIVRITTEDYGTSSRNSKSF